MGNPRRLIDALAAPPLVSSPKQLEVYRKNLNIPDPEDVDPEFRAPPPVDPAGSLTRQAKREFDDGGFVNPEELVGGTDVSLGNPALTQHMANEVFRQFQRTGKATSLPPGSVLGNAPTVRSGRPVWSRNMGESSSATVSQVRPQYLLDLMAGSPERGAEIASRQAARNDAFGKNGAVIYHMGNHQEALQQPWMVFRGGQSSPFSAPDGTQGYAEPLARSLFFNAPADYGNRASTAGRKPMNVASHEAIHAILHGLLPERNYGRARQFIGNDEHGAFAVPGAHPSVSEVDVERLHPQALYSVSHADELQNDLFHAARLTEATDPEMRDIGASRDSAANFFDYILNRDTRMRGFETDPIINLPGHYREGQRAWGMRDLLNRIQDVIKATSPKGHEAQIDTIFRSSQVPSLKEALLV
jgi:hypothetical protein